MYRSYVISWNLTKLCNLRCEHCYIDAGPLKQKLLADELGTVECFRVVDQIAEVNPNALLILTGGEPLLRADVFEIARYAVDLGLWPVIRITENLVEKIRSSGIKGFSLSLDALHPEAHDRFRKVVGAWTNTVEGSKILNEAGFPFIIQTTIHSKNLSEISAIARFAHSLGARVFNLYFLVPSGRGSYISDVTPEEYEGAMRKLTLLQEEFDGKMIVNAKCAPHYQRFLYEKNPESKFLKSFTLGAGGCPAGTHYAGIRPNGDVTPCPYLPVYGGNLRTKTFREIWDDSEVFTKIRGRKNLDGRCGPCEFNSVCGGCRARAFGKTGDFMAEDPWCTYQPGAHGGIHISFDEKTSYGDEIAQSVHWTDGARARLGNIPAFVRGMVSKRIESYARDHQIPEINEGVMDEIRKRVMGRIGGAPFFDRSGE